MVLALYTGRYSVKVYTILTFAELCEAKVCLDGIFDRYSFWEANMRCPYCGERNSEVVETRDSEDMETIRRRRSCLKCAKRFTTYERVENVHLVVIKKDKRREQFSRDKLRGGLLKACEKTLISVDEIERIVTEVIRELRGGESLEVESMHIGELIAIRLKKLDKVAYIRFASVFKRFVDVEEFEKEVKRLVN